MKGMGQGREIREGFPEVVTLGWAPKKSGCELREETEVDMCKVPVAGGRVGWRAWRRAGPPGQRGDAGTSVGAKVRVRPYPMGLKWPLMTHVTGCAFQGWPQRYLPSYTLF